MTLTTIIRRFSELIGVCAVAQGGTGATDAAAARANLGAADDAAVVHNAGDESIAGVKSFTDQPVMASGGVAITRGAINALVRIAGGGNEIVQLGPTTSGTTTTLLGCGGVDSTLGSAVRTQSDGAIVFLGVGGVTLASIDPAGVISGNGSGLTAVPGAGVIGDIAGKAASITGSITTAQVTGLDAELASKADDAAVAHLAGAETITGPKEFAAPIRVINAPAPGTPGAATVIETGDPNTPGLCIRGNLFAPASAAPDQVAGLKLWLKADSLALSDGATVATWPDASGQGNDAIGHGAPTYRAGIVGGKPVVRFASATDYFSFPDFLPGLGEGTAFVVVRVNNFDDNRGLWQFGGTGAGAGEHYPFFYDGSIRETFASTTQRTFAYNSSSALANFHIYEVRGGPGVWDAWRNGVSLISETTNTVGWPAAGTTYLGKGIENNSSMADIAEVIVYGSALSTQDRQSVESYLSAKYAIAVSGLASVDQSSYLLNVQRPDGASYLDADGAGNVALGLASPATTATDGFPYVPSGLGPPTGVPTAKMGFVPIYYDGTNDNLYVYRDGWKKQPNPFT